jgi:hypothetical protein
MSATTIKEELAPLIEEVIRNITSNEFTTYAFMTAFARFQEKAYVKALHANLDHPAGPFGAVKEILEKLLEEGGKASKLRDGARDMDMFGLPSVTILWQRKLGD